MSNIRIPFPNKYTHRTATKESTCFICGKFTTAVLTANADADWFFVCLNHLKDPSFCKPVPVPVPVPVVASKPQAAPRTPAKAPTKKEEEQDSSKQTEKEGKEAPEEKTSKKGTPSAKTKAAPPVEAAPSLPPPPPPPKDFILDSKIFYLREDAYRKKQMVKQAKQVSNSLPSVPRGL